MWRVVWCWIAPIHHPDGCYTWVVNNKMIPFRMEELYEKATNTWMYSVYFFKMNYCSSCGGGSGCGSHSICIYYLPLYALNQYGLNGISKQWIIVFFTFDRHIHLYVPCMSSIKTNDLKHVCHKAWLGLETYKRPLCERDCHVCPEAEWCLSQPINYNLDQQWQTLCLRSRWQARTLYQLKLHW